MREQIIVDTGALVALLDRSDSHHQWALDCFKALRPPLVTCESVLTECWHLLSYAPQSHRALATFCQDGLISVEFDLKAEMASVLRLLKKYEDTPMDFADACLVRMTEQISDCRIWTVDSDFQVYRRLGRKVIPVLAPWD